MNLFYSSQFYFPLQAYNTNTHAYIRGTDTKLLITDCVCNKFPEMNSFQYSFSCSHFEKSSHFCGSSAINTRKWHMFQTPTKSGVLAQQQFRDHTQVRYKCHKQVNIKPLFSGANGPRLALEVTGFWATELLRWNNYYKWLILVSYTCPQIASQSKV